MMRRVRVWVWAWAAASPIIASAASPPSIDGFLDDPWWAEHARVWELSDPRLPDNRARFMLGFDDEYLYFAADVTDGDVQITRPGRKVEVWRDDAVELFLDFGNGADRDRTPQTFEYGFSAAGGVNWTRGTSDGSGANYPGFRYPASWDSELTSAVHLKAGTTPNALGRRDRGYEIEAKIPWREMGQTPPFPPERTIGVCLVNVCRPEQDEAGDRPLASVADVDLSNRHNPSLWRRIPFDWHGPLAVRGLAVDLPLWLGTNHHHDRWKRFAAAETDPRSVWLDRSRWAGRLDTMVAHHLNALLLLHPHPFPGLCDLAGHPEAWYFPASELERQQVHFRWLLAEAKRRSIAVYLSVEDGVLPPGWDDTAGAPDSRLEAAEAQAYLRDAVAELFATYPDLTGLVSRADDHPPGSDDLVASGVVAGLNRAAADANRRSKPPELICSTTYRSPDQAARLLAAYSHARLLHPLQDGQWFMPACDPRLARYETAVADLRPAGKITRTLAMGGPGGPLAYLPWCDPRWLRDLVLDLRRQGSSGWFFQPTESLDWLSTEAFGAYAHDPGDAYQATRWKKRLEEVYGVGEHAGQLLEAIEHAGAIMPVVVRLVHDRSERYMPQCGLLLAHYLELPTLSTYVSDKTQLVDERGYLVPRGETTWPNPNWGVAVAGVRAYAQRKAPRGALEPDRIVAEIREHVEKAGPLLQNLRRSLPEDPQQAAQLTRLLDRLAFAVALGDHHRHKIEAAIGWARYLARRQNSLKCRRSLEASVEAWRKVVFTSEKVYPDPVPYWQSQIVSVPPWTRTQITAAYRRVVGHWRDQIGPFERELELVRSAVDGNREEAALPLWDSVTARPLSRLESMHRLDFDAERDLRYVLKPGATLTEEGEYIIGQGASLLLDTRELEGPQHLVLTTDPAHCPLQADRPHQIAFSYRVIDQGDPETTGFEVGFRPFGGGPPLESNSLWSAPSGHRGNRFIQVPPAPDQVLYITVRGKAALVIDQIDIAGYIDD